MSNALNGLHVEIDQAVLYEVELAFEGIWVLAFLIFIAASVLIYVRKREGAKVLPLWAIFAAQFSFLLVAILQIVSISRSVRATLGYDNDTSIAQYSTLLAFEELFMALASPLTFYVFYSVIHLVLGALKGVEKRYRKTRIFHWTCLALISAFSVIIWCWDTAAYRYQSQEEFEKGRTLFQGQPYIQAAYYIVLWLAAWENMGWTIFLAIRTVRSRTRLMLPSLFLLFAGMCWCSMKFLTALYIIVYTLNPATRSASGIANLGTTVISIVAIIMSIASWIGILLFCFRFASVQMEGEEFSSAQNTGNWTETSNPHGLSNGYYSSLQEGHRKLVAEADSSAVRSEMEAGGLCHEADAGHPIYEADASNDKISKGCY